MINQAWKKTLAAAAVMAAVPLANAAPNVTFAGGSGVLTFSTCDSSACFDGSDITTMGGLVSALNAGSVEITELGGAQAQIDYQDEADPSTRFAAKATALVTGATLDSTGAVTQVQSAGGVRMTGVKNSTLTGGYADVTNLRFDLTNKTIYADLSGVKSAVGSRPAATFGMPDQALWTFEAISGPTRIDPAALASADPVSALTAQGFSVTRTANEYQLQANNTISGLRITQVGFDFFKNSLGLLTPGTNALKAVESYGTVNSTLNFRLTAAAPVPEPEAVGLALVGVIVAGVAARRRRQLQAA